MYCNCMNITSINYKGKFQRVKTYADGICEHCHYYAKSSNETEHRVISNGRDISDLDRLVGKQERLVSHWHKKRETRGKAKGKMSHGAKKAPLRGLAKYNEAFRQNFVDDAVNQCKGIRQAAIDANIPHGTAHEWWRKYDGKNRLHNLRKEKISSLLARGLTIKEIAENVSMTPSTVRKFRTELRNG